MLADSLELLIDLEALHSQDAEDRYSTDGVSWQQYEALLTKREDRPGYRITYLDGMLEAVVTHNLPPLPPGKAYQLWFLTPDALQPSRTFHPQNDDGIIQVPLPSEQTRVAGAAVSEVVVYV